MKLSEFVEKYPGYKPYVEFLKNFFEKPVDEIYVYSFIEAAELGYVAGENVMGFAVPPDKVFFREMPPPLHTFIHELIHLCRKPLIEVGEEIYAYNLVNLVIFCVEKRIKCNPFVLFTLTVNDIERVLNRYGIESIEEFYSIIGIIPVNYELDFDEKWMFRIKLSKELLEHPDRDRIIVETFISELIAGIPYYTDESIETKILLDLIEIAGGSR